jgi:radical SAM-linked protein
MSVVTDPSDPPRERPQPLPTEGSPLPTEGSPLPADDATNRPLRVRYRVRFAKVDLLRWTSHRDLARLWERLVRRAALKLSMTEGFHPKPRIGFPSALALGVEGLDEVVELELAEELSPHELLARLRADKQPGLTIDRVSRLPDGFGKAQLRQSEYAVTIIAAADRQQTQQAIETLLGQETVHFERKHKTISADVQSQIVHLALGPHELQLTLASIDSASLRPGDVLDLLGIGDWIQQGAKITRTRVVLQNEFESDDPQLVATSETLPESSDGDDASPPATGDAVDAPR